MESKYPALEAIMISIALGAFLFYHVWLIFIRGDGFLQADSRSYGLHGKGKLARIGFTAIVCDNVKSAILGVQQARNGMMGVTFQASIAALFFNQILSIVLDRSQMNAVSTFSRWDPMLRVTPEDDDPTNISSIGLVSVLTVIVVNLAVVLVALMLFTVCIRLHIHMGFFYRAACLQELGCIRTQDAVEITLQAQVIYTMGQRLIFFFPITAMWVMGPTALLLTSAVVTTGVASLDRWQPLADKYDVHPAPQEGSEHEIAQPVVAREVQLQPTPGGAVRVAP